MSRPARNRTGSQKPRPPAAKRSGGAAPGGKPAAGTSTPAAPGAAKGAAKGRPAKPAAKRVPTPAPTSTPTPRAPATRPGPGSRGRAAVTVPGRPTWATSASVPVLLFSLLGLFLLGLCVGVGGAFVHYMRLGGLPTGTVLGVLAIGGVAFAGGVLLRSRLGAVLPAMGWLVAGMVLSSPKGEGDILIGGAGMDYGFLLGGVALLLAECALPYAQLSSVIDGADPSP